MPWTNPVVLFNAVCVVICFASVVVSFVYYIRAMELLLQLRDLIMYEMDKE